MYFYVYFTCFLAIANARTYEIYDRDALQTCREIYPPPFVVYQSDFSNGGCRLACKIARQKQIHNTVVLANNGTACGLAGFCNEGGGCVEPSQTLYENLSNSSSLCEYYDQGTFMHCVFKGEQCGPNRICNRKTCVLDEYEVEEQVENWINALNGTRMCVAKNDRNIHGRIKEFGCSVECLNRNGSSVTYGINNGKQCHFKSKCVESICEGATQLLDYDYSKINITRFKQDIQDLMYDEFVIRGPDARTEASLFWKERALNRTLPFFRLPNNGIPTGFEYLRITPMRTRLNYLTEIQQIDKFKRVFPDYKPTWFFGPKMMEMNTSPRPRYRYFIPHSVWRSKDRLLGLNLDCNQTLLGDNLCPLAYIEEATIP